VVPVKKKLSLLPFMRKNVEAYLHSISFFIPSLPVEEEEGFICFEREEGKSKIRRIFAGAGFADTGDFLVSFFPFPFVKGLIRGSRGRERKVPAEIISGFKKIHGKKVEVRGLAAFFSPSEDFSVLVPLTQSTEIIINSRKVGVPRSVVICNKNCRRKKMEEVLWEKCMANIIRRVGEGVYTTTFILAEFFVEGAEKFFYFITVNLPQRAEVLPDSSVKMEYPLTLRGDNLEFSGEIPLRVGKKLFLRGFSSLLLFMEGGIFLAFLKGRTHQQQ